MNLYAVTLTDAATGKEVTIELYADNPIQAQAFGQNMFAASRGETFDPGLHLITKIQMVLRK